MTPEEAQKKWSKLMPQLEKAVKALDATGKHGVALLKASIFDVSEYTEGTGFKATVYNSTKKPSST